MSEFIQLAFSKVNFIATVLAILFAIYWVVTIFTGLDFDTADSDLALHHDGDLHHDAGPHKDFHHGESQADGHYWHSVLKFFHIGELPILFIFSFVSIFMWLIMINTSAWLGWQDKWIGLVLYIPAFILAMLVSKVAIIPFLKLYRVFNHKGEESIDFIGKVGAVYSVVKPDKLGQIEIRNQGDVIRVYAKSIDHEIYEPGSQVIILEASPDQKFFFVQSYNL
ncbi:hypothetical protein GCM10027051_02530 [Niabella terrae]